MHTAVKQTPLSVMTSPESQVTASGSDGSSYSSSDDEESVNSPASPAAGTAVIVTQCVHGLPSSTRVWFMMFMYSITCALLMLTLVLMLLMLLLVLMLLMHADAEVTPQLQRMSLFNIYRSMLHNLTEDSDFAFIFTGISRLLNNIPVADSTYLPYSTKKVMMEQ